jgi:hypothetical protein
MKSVALGAAISIHVASDLQFQGVTGRCFTNGRPRTSSVRSRDQHVASRLWEAREDLVRSWTMSPGAASRVLPVRLVPVRSR